MLFLSLYTAYFVIMLLTVALQRRTIAQELTQFAAVAQVFIAPLAWYRATRLFLEKIRLKPSSARILSCLIMCLLVLGFGGLAGALLALSSRVSCYGVLLLAWMCVPLAQVAAILLVSSSW
jgi:hypothetical protein